MKALQKVLYFANLIICECDSLRTSSNAILIGHSCDSYLGALVLEPDLDDSLRQPGLLGQFVANLKFVGNKMQKCVSNISLSKSDPLLIAN